MRDDIIKALCNSCNYADSTWRIAKRLGLTTRSVRSELLKMEKDGLVERVIAWCTSNNTFWRIAP